MTLSEGWVLGAMTWACLGLACDTPRPPGAKAPLVRRAFPETADLHADPSPVTDRLGAPGIVTPVSAPSPGAGASVVADRSLPSPKPERVAAVLLMLPADGDDLPGSRGTRTYKVSLGADLGEASVEIDGHDMGAMPVRRVYPQPRVVARGPERPTPPAAGPPPVAALSRAVVAGQATVDPLSGDMPRVRSARRAVTASDGRSRASQQPIMTSNGAPIID